jgi:methyl-accepting chemotaxis protein
MSFRSRLTGFFVMIVVVPMIAFGVLAFTLIDSSSRAKIEARAAGTAVTADSYYLTLSRNSALDAKTLAADPGVSAAIASGSTAALEARLATLERQAGIARVTVKRGTRPLADVGDRSAVAPGVATVVGVAGPGTVAIAVAEKSAAEYASALSGQGVAIVVRKDGYTIASSLPGAGRAALPASRDSVRIDGVEYEALTRAMSGFGTAKIYVTVLSDAAMTSTSGLLSRLSAIIFIVAFLVLAFSFSVLASRALQGQIARFLQAARRLAGGDFSAPVPTDGHDEFAALGTEFNNM